MSETTTVRVDRATHEELKRLARERKITIAETTGERCACSIRRRWVRI
jgi:predicted DNA-binding ribbon-helix-helix protein